MSGSDFGLTRTPVLPLAASSQLCCTRTSPFSSVASEVVTQVCERGFDLLDHQPLRVNSDDVPAPYAKNLESAFLPNKHKIMTAVRKTLNRL